MKNPIFLLLIIITCLSSGTLIYVATRAESIYINQWIDYLTNGKVILFFRGIFQNVSLPKWFIYSLPDGLWMFALTLLILMIWNFRLNKKSIPWISVAMIAGISIEFFQQFHIVPGTFDIVDLIFILLGALFPVSMLILKMILKNQPFLAQG